MSSQRNETVGEAADVLCVFDGGFDAYFALCNELSATKKNTVGSHLSAETRGVEKQSVFV